MQEFLTAVEQDEKGDDDAYPFKIDGHECVCYKPGTGQFAVLMASAGRYASEVDQTAAIINFFASVLDDKSYAYVERRLLDRTDRFGIEQVEKIMYWMVEEWGGHPTEGPTASSPSRPAGGSKSTPRTKVSTS